MTTVRTITPAESEELWVDGTFRGMTHEGDPRTLYDGYFQEGHLVCLTLWDDHPTDQAWFVHCTCGENAWGMTSEEMLAIAGSHPAQPLPELLNFGQVVMWHRDHRAEQGLEKQELAPTRSIEELRKHENPR